MKNILIVISNMGIGGAEKSLLSFLKSMQSAPKGEEYRIHLMVVNSKGTFCGQIPEKIVRIEPPKALRWLGNPFHAELLTKYFSLTCLMGEAKWLIKKTLKRFPKQWNRQQCLWDCWKDTVPQLPGHYDAAISYLDGFTNYYVMEKVSAHKKILWVHSQYQKRNYNPGYDASYFEKADGVVTISEQCKQCIVQEFPHLSEQVFVLENITIPEEVLEKSSQGECPEFADKLRLLTVARLNPLKGVDIAIEAAKKLKTAGIDFQWLVVGDGPEHGRLQDQIDRLELGDCVSLLGSRENPYVYMNACDILVQSSRVEGRSIVLDEAKILEKPIVATNYTTVTDALVHGKTGWIVDMTPQAVAEGILRLHRDEALCRQLRENLKNQPKGNTSLVQRYIDIMF